MASRQEEKERRRREREEAEAAAAAKEKRGRRLRLLGGAALLVLALAGVGVAIAMSGGSSKSKSSKPTTTPNTGLKASIPEQKTAELNAAAGLAGCRLTSFPKGYEDRGHVSDSTQLKFETNPPVFGKHYEIPASDGNYAGQGSPPPGNWLHSLEHGRIIYQYRPGLPKKQIAQLEKLYAEDPDLVLLMENNTGMKADVAALAWTHQAICPQMGDKVFDAFRAFRKRWKLKAPEVFPQPQ